MRTTLSLPAQTEGTTARALELCRPVIDDPQKDARLIAWTARLLRDHLVWSASKPK